MRAHTSYTARVTLPVVFGPIPGAYARPILNGIDLRTHVIFSLQEANHAHSIKSRDDSNSKSTDYYYSCIGGTCVDDGTSLSFSTDEMLGMWGISVFYFCSDWRGILSLIKLYRSYAAC